jgi:hypothetical protein
VCYDTPVCYDTQFGKHWFKDIILENKVFMLFNDSCDFKIHKDLDLDDESFI